jgi:cation diffusion facilitator CzcD-associated flavoprotein CzcO
VGVPAAARRPAGRPALQQPNVEVIASGLAEVRPRSVVADDGTEREVDTIVFGTGFRVTDYPAGDRIVSADRTSLSDAFSWRFWQRTRRFEPRDYVRRPRLAPVPVAREPDVV